MRSQVLSKTKYRTEIHVRGSRTANRKNLCESEENEGLWMEERSE